MKTLIFEEPTISLMLSRKGWLDFINNLKLNKLYDKIRDFESVIILFFILLN